MNNTKNKPTMVGITLAATVLVCLVILAGPLTVTQGMSEADVDALMGIPASTKHVGNSTALLYKQHEFIGFGWRIVDYAVVISDGKVTDYGADAFHRLSAAHE